MKTKVARFIVLLSLCACESIAPIGHNGSECFNLENCDIGFICIGATPNSAGLCLRPSQPLCGDGLVRQGLALGEPGYEGCDDGNLSNTDGCSNGCVSARCGDGFIRNDLDPMVAGFDSPYENCEDGNLVDDDACTNLCQRARCGDGVLRSGLQAGDSGFEACDDGNLVGGDACTSLCMPARCGDGFVQTGVDECDDGNLEDRDACTNACTLARCGDGVARVDIAEGEPGFEVCDDGNDDDLDSCSNACLGAACGDGVVQDGENCDDGNRQDDDACDNYCGVGIVQLLLGQTFSCALVANSDVYCWGSNESGELGLNDRISRGRATKLADLGSVVSLHGAQSRGVRLAREWRLELLEPWLKRRSLASNSSLDRICQRPCFSKPASMRSQTRRFSFLLGWASFISRRKSRPNGRPK